MTTTPTRMERVEAALSRLSEREQKLLVVMVVVVATMMIAIGSYTVGTALDERRERVETKRASLETLLTRRQTFLADAAEADRLREQLTENELRLSTFIEGRAGRAGIPRPREFRDSTQPLDGDVTAHITTATFAEITLEQMQALLTSIEGAEELVYTRQLSFQPERRGSGGLQLELTLTTFRQEEAE